MRDERQRLRFARRRPEEVFHRLFHLRRLWLQLREVSRARVASSTAAAWNVPRAAPLDDRIALAGDTSSGLVRRRHDERSAELHGRQRLSCRLERGLR
jgi:hypothetical protein